MRVQPLNTHLAVEVDVEQTLDTRFERHLSHALGIHDVSGPNRVLAVVSAPLELKIEPQGVQRMRIAVGRPRRVRRMRCSRRMS